MNPVLKKLGLAGQNPVLIMNAPDEYRGILVDIEADVHTGVKGKYTFIQIFARDMAEAVASVKESLPALEGDGHLWLCYPKGTSKKYKSDLNRTKTWEVFAPYNFEPVTQVAIDDDWSALRFRHVDQIKTMTRKTAATEKGRERINSEVKNKGCQ